MNDTERLDELERLIQNADLHLPWTAHEMHSGHESWTDETYANFGKRVSHLWSILAGPGEISSDAYVYDENDAKLIVAVINASRWLIGLARKGLTLAKHIATQEHYREIAERSEKYEKALRRIADGCGWPVCDAIRDIAREVLEKP